jgi:hypothetical protein
MFKQICKIDQALHISTKILFYIIIMSSLLMHVSMENNTNKYIYTSGKLLFLSYY